MQNLKTHFGDVIHDPQGVDKLCTLFAAKNGLAVDTTKLAKVKNIAGGEIDFTVAMRNQVVKDARSVAMAATNEILELPGAEGNKAVAIIIQQVKDFRILNEEGRKAELREWTNRHNKTVKELDNIKKIASGDMVIV